MSSKQPSGAAGQGSETGRSEAFAALAGGLVHELNNLRQPAGCGSTPRVVILDPRVA
jgi:hypothetical protein